MPDRFTGTMLTKINTQGGLPEDPAKAFGRMSEETDKALLDLVKKTNTVSAEAAANLARNGYGFVAKTVDSYGKTYRIFDGSDFRPTEKLVKIAGVARCTAGTWALINDADHAPKNITGISTLAGGGFRITYPTVAKVASLIAAPDEEYAKLGYTVGASVGLAYSDINVCGRFVSLVEDTKKAMWFRRSAGVYGYVYYNGSAWTSSDSVGLTSYAFNATTGELTINHNAAGLSEISIVPRCIDAYDEAMFSSYAANATYIKFVRTGIVPNAQASIAGSNVWIYGEMYMP
jgi:hypothetical protein